MGKKQINSTSGKKKQVNTSPNARSQGSTSTTNTSRSEASGDQSKAGTSSVPAHAPTGKTTFYGHVYRLSKNARGYVVKQLPLVVPGLVLMLLGFKQLPQSIPLLAIAKEHQVASPIIGTVLVVLFLAAMIISFLPEPKDDGNKPKRSKNWPIRPWVIATTMSTTSFVLSSILLLIVLIRPAWCPGTLCLASQPLIYGPHDANLEVDFIAIQSPAYVLANDPAQYSLSSKNLPRSNDQRSIAAMRIDGQETSTPYLVALNIHNLRSQGFSMIIEEVALVVRQTPPIPHPLNVWVQPPSILYQSGNLYSVSYRGQEGNAVLPATYAHLPGGKAQLKPVETDSLLVQVVTDLVAATALRFSVQITYRFANEAHRYTFTPPYVFEIVFAKASNWNPYHLQGGQLVKGE